MAPQDRDSERQAPDQTTPSEGSEHLTPHHQPPTDQLSRVRSGGAPAMADETLETNEIIAVIAAIVPGLGQMFLGQPVKGIVVLAISILTCVGGGILSVLSVLDAFLVAKAKKRREVREWEFFPDFKETFEL